MCLISELGVVRQTIQFIYLGFYIAFNNVRVISQWAVGRAEETSTYSSLGFCTVNCRPSASSYQLSHMRPCREPNPGLRGGRRECYHSVTVAPRHTIQDIMYKSKVVKHGKGHNQGDRQCSLVEN